MFYISAIAFIMLVIVVIANVCLLYGCIKVSKLLHTNVYNIMIYTYICLFMTYSTNMIHSICMKTINVVKLNQTCHLCTENSIRNGWVYEIQVGFLYIIYHSLKSYSSLPHLRSVSKHTVFLRGFPIYLLYIYILRNLNHLNHTSLYDRLSMISLIL